MLRGLSFVEYLLGETETLQGHREPAVNRGLDQHFGDFLAARAVVDRTADVGLELVVLAAVARARKLSDRVDRKMARILHGDVPTFMQSPPLVEVDNPDLIVAGFPYEGVRVWAPDMVVPPSAARRDPDIYARAGAHLAPDEIRRQSIHLSLEHGPGGYFPEWDREYRIVDAVSVCDGGDLPVDEGHASELVLKNASDVLLEMIGKASVPILLGGDDTVPYVGVRAAARQRGAKLGVIKFDSHYDLAVDPPFWAGSQWIPLMEEGYLEPHNLAIIGIRGLRNRTMLHEIATELGVPYWTMSDVDDQGIVTVVREALSKLDDDVDYIYLSLDLDVIDPAFLPAQKYPEPGGLTAREIIRAIRTVIRHGSPLCGFDMACLGPQYDVNGLGGHLAARCAAEVIGGIGFVRKRGKP